MGFSVKDFEYGIPAGILILEAGSQGRILFANGDAMRLYGYDAGDYSLIGKRWIDTIMPEERQKIRLVEGKFRIRDKKQKEKGHSLTQWKKTVPYTDNRRAVHRSYCHWTIT